METNQAALEKCLQTALQFGTPRDLAEKFISIGYVPLPWQWEFHAIARQADLDNGPVDIGLGGARGPGKSHAVLSQSGLDDCQRVPGLKGLFLRQTGTAAKESFDDLVDKVLRGRIKYNKTGFLLAFPNGSKILLGGFKDQNDIDKYVGIEYDFIIVEELNQLSEDKYTKLRGSLRTSKPDWRPRMYTSFNPGGRGHKFIKKRYIQPSRDKQETETRFIGSTYRSNPYLNKEYIQYLEGLEGDLGKAWRDGEWDLFSGQYFDSFSVKKHVVNPFVPRDELVVGGMDWGRAKPFAFYLATVQKLFLRNDISGDIDSFYRVKTFYECYGTEKNPEDWGNQIKESIEDRFKLKLTDISWVQCDPTIFNKGNDNSVSIRDQFYRSDNNWRILQPAKNDRISGWNYMKRWMSNAPDGNPYWQITDNCTNLIRTLPDLQHDQNNVEDLDTEDEDHPADASRYLLRRINLLEGITGQIKSKIAVSSLTGNQAKFFTPNENMDQHLLDLSKFR